MIAFSQSLKQSFCFGVLLLWSCVQFSPKLQFSFIDFVLFVDRFYDARLLSAFVWRNYLFACVYGTLLCLLSSMYWICLNVTFLLGFFDVNRDEASSLKICQHHRDRLGIYWRGRCKNCQVQPEVAQHKTAAVKGDRSLVKDHSQYIKNITAKLIPVGSGKKAT